MSIGRPRQFDPDNALECAMETFWSRGYEATSLQDLLAAMSLSKSSLYQSFGDKPRLFERCLRRYAVDRERELRAALEAAVSARGFIEAAFRDVADDAGTPRGCLLMNTASELGARDPVMARAVADGVARFTRVFRDAVAQGQREGDIPADRDTEALARYLVANMTGLRTLRQAGAAPADIHETIGLVLRALD